DNSGPGLWRVTTDGTSTIFHTATNSSIAGLTAGPDGNIWFADSGRSEIGRLTLAGARVTNVSSTNPDGIYGLGQIVQITVDFDNSVTVTGTPQIALNSGGFAIYSAGSGTSTLTFTYTVAPGQSATRLDLKSSVAMA